MVLNVRENWVNKSRRIRPNTLTFVDLAFSYLGLVIDLTFSYLGPQGAMYKSFSADISI